MDYRLLFPREYLGAPDLKGKDVTLTIRRIVVEDLETKDGKEKKGIVYFEETKAAAEKQGIKEKRLVLNKTNAKTIAAIYGNEVDDWTGRRVTLFPTTCQSFGETVDCIRVRPGVPAKTATETATEE